MNQAQYSTLTHLIGKLPNWQKTDYRIAKKLNDAIPYIGDVTITSTYREGTGSLHTYTESLAVDFVPKSKSLWAVYLILVRLGFRRIGLRPDANMIHVDCGVEAGVAREYLFFEGPGGVDWGPLSGQTSVRLASIPGYSGTGGTAAVASVAGGTTPAAVVVSIIIIAGLLWSRFKGYI